MDGGTDASSGGSAGADGGPTFTHNVVFVTAQVTAGEALGGLAGADAICNAEAAAAGLKGNYMAWLSSSVSNAPTRIAATGARGWVRRDGLPFVDTMADLAALKFYYPVRLLADGTVAPNTVVLTGTMQDGTVSANTCADWTANDSKNTTGGSSDAMSGKWTQAWGFPCTSKQRLFCFGVDKSVALTPTFPAGRRVFVSFTAAPRDQGVAALDALCTADAVTYSQPGSEWKAFVATTTGPATSRVDLTGLPWTRQDGVPILPKAGDLAVRDDVDAPPLFRANGQFWTGDVFTGATSPSATGSAQTTCANWGSAAATDKFQKGLGHRAAADRWFNNGPKDCDYAFARVICMANKP